MKKLFCVIGLGVVLISCSKGVEPIKLWFDNGVCYQEWSDGNVTQTDFGNPKSVEDCAWG